MDTCWISCQVITDMETFYDDLIIINLYLLKSAGWWPPCPLVTHGPAVRHPRIIAVQTSATPNRDGGRLQNSKGTPNIHIYIYYLCRYIYLYFCSLFHILAKNGVPSVPHNFAGIDHHHTYQIASILPKKKLAWLCYCKLQIDDIKNW